MTKAITTNPEPTPVAVIDVNQMVADFKAMAMNPDVDADKMATLYALQKQVMTDARLEVFNRAKFNAMANMPSIERDGVIRGNDGKVRSRYSTFKHLYQIAKPVLAAEGMVLDFDVDETNLETKVPTLRVRPILRHQNGYVWEGSYMPVPIVAANSTVTLTQAAKGAVETGKRVTLISCLGITEEENPANDPPPPMDPAEEAIYEAGQRAAASGVQAYQAWWQSKALNDAQRRWMDAQGFHAKNKLSALEIDDMSKI
jgi:hypothetical protein